MATFEIYGERYRSIRPRKSVPVFIRYGLFKGMRRSSNHATGEAESGVSVYPAKLVDGHTVTLADDAEVCEALVGQGRLCFPVTGTVVDTGSDGEPVIRGITMLAYAVDIKCKR
jgi:hypothetical protein